ncbi:MAG: hypothetical protein MUD01_13345 [Chloroflexaceae bacterium]|jgi:hypothetical protein|nr:hypothetical protein [Chloroflexaceae bacterium]
MSAILEKIADELARTALRLEEELGDLDVVERIAKHIGTSSPTVEEAFRTAVRMRRAEASAIRYMAKLGGKAAPRTANLPARRDVAEGKT